MTGVTVLGSGTVDPQPSRASVSFFIHSLDSELVIDLGPGSVRNSVAAKVPLYRLKHLFFTHHHPDHMGDLVTFLFARRCAPGDWQMRPGLKIYGPPGTRSLVDGLLCVWPSLRPKEEQLEVVDLSFGETVKLAQGIDVVAYRALHGDRVALSYALVTYDGRVAFSGDTAVCPGVIEAARGAKLFFCEASCGARAGSVDPCREVHLGIDDVQAICNEAKPSRLVLTHLYDGVIASDPKADERLSKELGIPVEYATDLLTIELK